MTKCPHTKYSIIVRHSLHRIISHLRHFCVFRKGLCEWFWKHSSTHLRKFFNSLDLLLPESLEVIAKSVPGLRSIDDMYRLRQFSNNYLTRFLSHRGKELEDKQLRPVSLKDFENALKNIHAMDLILTDDNIDSICGSKLMQRHFNSTVHFQSVDPLRFNRIEDFPLSYTDLIDDNLFDLKLYWAARQINANQCKLLS